MVKCRSCNLPLEDHRPEVSICQCSLEQIRLKPLLKDMVDALQDDNHWVSSYLDSKFGGRSRQKGISSRLRALFLELVVDVPHTNVQRRRYLQRAIGIEKKHERRKISKEDRLILRENPNKTIKDAILNQHRKKFDKKELESFESLPRVKSLKVLNFAAWKRAPRGGKGSDYACWRFWKKWWEKHKHEFKSDDGQVNISDFSQIFCDRLNLHWYGHMILDKDLHHLDTKLDSTKGKRITPWPGTHKFGWEKVGWALGIKLYLVNAPEEDIFQILRRNKKMNNESATEILKVFPSDLEVNKKVDEVMSRFNNPRYFKKIAVANHEEEEVFNNPEKPKMYNRGKYDGKIIYLQKKFNRQDHHVQKLRDGFKKLANATEVDLDWSRLLNWSEDLIHAISRAKGHARKNKKLLLRAIKNQERIVRQKESNSDEE